MTNQRTRNDHRHRRFAPAIVIAVVVIGASIFASAHLGSATSVTETATTLRSLTNTTGTTLYAPGPCLKEVPQERDSQPCTEFDIPGILCNLFQWNRRFLLTQFMPNTSHT